MGEGMLVTVGALMPGGVLPPAATGQTGRDRDKQWAFQRVVSETLRRGFALTGHPVKCQRDRSTGPAETLFVGSDSLPQCTPSCDTTTIKPKLTEESSCTIMVNTVSMGTSYAFVSHLMWCIWKYLQHKFSGRQPHFNPERHIQFLSTTYCMAPLLPLFSKAAPAFPEFVFFFFSAFSPLNFNWVYWRSFSSDPDVWSMVAYIVLSFGIYKFGVVGLHTADTVRRSGEMVCCCACSSHRKVCLVFVERGVLNVPFNQTIWKGRWQWMKAGLLANLCTLHESNLTWPAAEAPLFSRLMSMLQCSLRLGLGSN